MPERDTKLFEVLIGQIAKNGGVDVTLGKTIRVLGHAELFEPVGDLLHCREPLATELAAVLPQNLTIVSLKVPFSAKTTGVSAPSFSLRVDDGAAG